MMNELSTQLSIWTQRLRAIAVTGLAFDPRVYDRERYEELLNLAAEIAATTSQLETDTELAQALYKHWRASVVPGVKGYVTPKVGVAAVVFNNEDELLLIQRPSGHWLVPTGWADVGYSPAQVVVKEVREETGLRVTPTHLIGVFDVRRLIEPELELHFYSLWFYCRLEGGTLNRHETETLDAGFYPLHNLPEPLARGDLPWVEQAWAAHNGELIAAYFDPA